MFCPGILECYILCGVVTMHVTYLLLGCTWQLHKKAKYDGFKNIYSLENDAKTFTLVSLSPKQVYQDQLKMKKKEKMKVHNNHMRIRARVKIMRALKEQIWPT